MAPSHLGHGRNVCEVDDLGDIGDREGRSIRTAIDGDHAHAELAHACDRTPLMPTGADEENGLHGRAMLLRDGVDPGVDQLQRTPGALRPKVITAVMTISSLIGPLDFLAGGSTLGAIAFSAAVRKGDVQVVPPVLEPAT